MNHRTAFSLIEFMIVICLLCSLIGLGMMQISFLDNIIVRTEIDKLSSVCAYLRQLAMSTNHDKYLSFDRQKNEYRFENSIEKLSQNVCFGFLPGVKGPPGSSLAPVEKAITFPHQKIVFYSSGIVSSGTVYLIDKKKNIQYALSNAVSQVSYLRKYCYSGFWKLCS